MAEQSTDKAGPAPRDPRIRRRRLWLYGASLLALIVVAIFAGKTLLGGDDEKKAPPRPEPPVIVERIRLKPVGGGRARGLAELVRHKTADGLRVLAVRLTPTQDGQVYQLLLTAKDKEDRLLGNQAVNDQKTFLGEAKLSADELHEYSRIELRLTTQGNPPTSKPILRGAIPR